MTTAASPVKGQGSEPVSDLVPLCIDLDGTFLRTDTLVEGVLKLAKTKPFRLLQILWLAFVSRASFKARVASLVQLDAERLPINDAFVNWLRQEHANGRQLVLCTAADQRIAQDIARHYGFFTRIIATEGKTNLSGRNKAERLVAEYGEFGYDYAGNEMKDAHVWEKARRAIVVAPGSALRARLASVPRMERTFDSQPVPAVRTWLRAIRLHQWAKNALIFVPAIASHRLLEPQVFLASAAAFIVFGLCASGTYLLNDLMDLDDDRQHPTKRARPFASSQLSLITGTFVAAGMIGFAIVASFVFLGPLFFGVLAIYLIATVCYSGKIKRIPMVDILTLASLYTLRVIAGAAATQIRPSFWLLAFSIFLFLSLAAAKRYAELVLMLANSKRGASGRGYVVEDLPLVQSCGIAAGYLSVLVLALYINSGAAGLYARPEAIWLLCPLLIYWINRIWLKTHRGLMHDDPLVFTLSDRASQFAGGIAVLLVLIAI